MPMCWGRVTTGVRLARLPDPRSSPAVGCVGVEGPLCTAAHVRPPSPRWQVILTALLNDCSKKEEEVLLSVSWGEATILQDMLEQASAACSTQACARMDTHARSHARTLTRTRRRAYTIA